MAKRIFTPKFVKTYLSDPSTYPVVVAVGAGVTLCTGYCYRNMAYHPDLRFSQSRRHAGLEENQAEGARFHQMGARFMVNNDKPGVVFPLWDNLLRSILGAPAIPDNMSHLRIPPKPLTEEQKISHELARKIRTTIYNMEPEKAQLLVDAMFADREARLEGKSPKKSKKSSKGEEKEEKAEKKTEKKAEKKEEKKAKH